jgi:hypothetical protein
VNYILLMSLFYELVVADNRLSAFHVSMYLGLFQLWNKNRFSNPIEITRKELMLLSRIGSTHTYYKTLKDLNQWGYIKYIPSKSPLKNSYIHLSISDTSSAQAVLLSCSTFDTSSAQAVHPSLINSINIINNKTYRVKEKKSFTQSLKKSKEKMFKKDTGGKRKKVAAKKESISTNPPNELDVKLFFNNEQSSETEASKFFNHYTSNGWTVGGGNAQMYDWNASARKWILNIKPQKSLKLNQNKNYNEQL